LRTGVGGRVLSAIGDEPRDAGLGIGGLRVAIAHDALVYRGGAERVVAAWLARWPNTPVFTSAYLPDATFESFRSADVRTSFVQYVATTPHAVMRRVFPLMVPGFRTFDFSKFDVVLSSAAYAAKAISVPRSVCHISYCYSPLRIAWRPEDYMTATTPSVLKKCLRVSAAVLRLWDYRVAQRIDYYATTCSNVARRIEECYDRSADVIHAPIDMHRYKIASEPDDYYLVVSRLFAYKRVDLAIQAMQRLGRKLVIAGEGPERSRLERLAAGSGIKFLGAVSDTELIDLYARCRAFIFPPEEDYGLTPLEAQASGRAVIAYGAGGALETVIDGETGLFFSTQTVESVIDAVLRFEGCTFSAERIRRHAAAFDIEVFCDRVAGFVADKFEEFKANGGSSRR
jgi:glycosyltransferase involved in cell wall biosynthesis